MKKIFILLLTLFASLFWSVTASAASWGFYYNSGDVWRQTHHDDAVSEERLPFKWYERREVWNGHNQMKIIYDVRWGEKFPGTHAYRWHDDAGFYHHGQQVKDAVFFYDDNDRLVSVGYWANGVFIHFRADHACYESADPFFAEVRQGIVAAPGWHDTYDGERWNHHMIALKSMANGKFVTAENDGRSALIANRDWAREWETFEIVHLGNHQIALRSVTNGKFVSAANDGNSPLIANRSKIGEWETFKIVYLGNRQIALKSMANGQFVSADHDGTSSLIANRERVRKWETFEVIDN
ncbi:fascin domain-containing protein [Propionispora hippei]|uniref:DUF7910 domain-containing protein n=1 Tax=Propionispora hippei DSM 15287 TaxID=1123003 RepID=A0A1M6APV3_9FIRM|nr:hypothetical protein [Propionispora hippei]SHI38539.1 hypothetical protein SAMN02745170_00246 [Propionispora hippei DSM 15287]